MIIMIIIIITIILPGYDHEVEDEEEGADEDGEAAGQPAQHHVLPAHQLPQALLLSWSTWT